MSGRSAARCLRLVAGRKRGQLSRSRSATSPTRVLKEQSGLRPAPYLASRGLKWIQHFAKTGLSDRELREHIRQSLAVVSQGLSKKKRIELGLAAP